MQEAGISSQRTCRNGEGKNAKKTGNRGEEKVETTGMAKKKGKKRCTAVALKEEQKTPRKKGSRKSSVDDEVVRKQSSEKKVKPGGGSSKEDEESELEEEEGNGEGLGDVWVYDTWLREWTEIVPRSDGVGLTPRSGHTATLYEDRIYVIGGIQRVNKFAQNEVVALCINGDPPLCGRRGAASVAQLARKQAKELKESKETVGDKEDDRLMTTVRTKKEDLPKENRKKLIEEKNAQFDIAFSTRPMEVHQES